MATELVKQSDKRQMVRQWFMDPAQMAEIARAAPKHIDPERLARVALTACVTNQKLFNCTRESLMQATLQSASLGLMPDGILGQAYLVPYGDRASFQLGYQGILELAMRTDRIAGIITDVVHAKDKFEFWREVTQDHFLHRPYEGDDDPGPVTHAYCIVRRKDGTASVTVLPKAKIEREHRAHSRARNEGPWVTHWEAMARKTAILVALKYEQKSTDLARAIAVEERTDQGIEIPPEDVKILDATEAKPEPEKSTLEKLASAIPDAAIPECAGCGKNKPAPLAVDEDGRAFHQDCLEVLVKERKAKK